MRRIRTAVLTAVAVAALVPIPASAQRPGDKGAPVISPSHISVIEGSPVMFTVDGLCASALVSITVSGSVVGSTTTDNDGDASLPITAPTVPGHHDVVVAGAAKGCALSVSTTITVLTVDDARAISGRGNTSSGTWVGGIAVIIGLGLFATMKFRRHPRAVAT